MKIQKGLSNLDIQFLMIILGYFLVATILSVTSIKTRIFLFNLSDYLY